MSAISAEEWEKISEIAASVLELNVEARSLFLKDLEISNPTWKKEIESLLLHESPDSDFLEKPAMTLLSFGDLAASGFGGDVPSLKNGEQIDDFEICQRLGEGAFASVYLAKQVSLGRNVALKVSRNMGLEARTMASLEHSNIVQMFSESVDAQRNVRYLCMQFVPGLTLETIISMHQKQERTLTGASILSMIDEAMPTELQSFDRSAIKERDLLASLDSFETVLWLGNQISGALGFAHSRRVLHLDVKPSNILISGYGRALLSDFNVSVTRQIDSETAPVVLGGTLNYMSAEHKSAFLNSAKSIEALDHRADIYSLGVVLKEVLKVSSLKGEPKLAIASLELLLKECTAESVDARIQKASDLSRGLGACSEYRSVLCQLPEGQVYLRFAGRHPALVYTLGVLIPQVVASIFNVFYNESRVVNQLSSVQQRFFERVVLAWNPIIFLICGITLIWVRLPIQRFIRQPAKLYAEGTLSLASVRHRIMQFPFWVAVITSLGWATASLMFPTVIHFFCAPITASVFWHFQISFFLSWLIATTYSFTNAHFFGLRVLYPQLWVGCRDIRKTAKEELTSIGRRVRPLHFMAGLIPLIGAALMVVVGPESLEGRNYQVFQILLLGFVGLAVFGLYHAVVATRQLSETLFALTGHEFREEA